jgi:hypothetical protein
MNIENNQYRIINNIMNNVELILACFFIHPIKLNMITRYDNYSDKSNKKTIYNKIASKFEIHTRITKFKSISIFEQYSHMLLFAHVDHLLKYIAIYYLSTI